MTKVERIDAFVDAVAAQCEARDARQERGEVAAQSQAERFDTFIAKAKDDIDAAYARSDERRAAAGYHSPLATSAACAGTEALVRNLADGMRAGDWDGYAARHKLENVHRHLIDWSLEPGCSDARWQALKDARQIVTRAIMGMCR